MINGPWDVDNDNDGIRDSVWIDFGAPVMPGPNGKLVKPLAAILCVDMDGRLNVNTHSTLELANDNANLWSAKAPTQTVANNVPSIQLPRGSGFGPAEIGTNFRNRRST